MNFKIFKSGQGYYTRLITAIAAFVIVAIGCFRLYQILGAADIANANTLFLVQLLVPGVVLAGFSYFAFWLVNTPRFADFLIAGEGEMKKVSWSSRKEITASTIVVISVVVIMSCLMAGADVVFQILFRAIGVIPK